ncbi:MAG: flagellar motor protein [Firmicutes bacterium]|nr:flagellar motor protein [Bacillota bacterium]MCL5038449.1 flagellar motor protein [Bacillota bacterium]
MDMATILGLTLALGALVISILMDGGKLSSLVSPSALLLIMGGTLGATIISFPMEEVANLPKILMLVFFSKKADAKEAIDRVVSLAEKARREGLLILQEDAKNITDKFLLRGLNLVIDGADPEMVKTIMETDLAFTEKRHKRGAAILEAAGGYAPTMGIIGTVMGLVHVLGNLEDTSKLGPAIAVAFLATFYGISTANIFWLPMANKLKERSREEMLLKEITLEGILSIQAGENPRIVREKLEVFLPPKLQMRQEEKARVERAEA